MCTCVLELKLTSVLASNPSTCDYLSVAIPFTKGHNMAVYESDLIAYQMVKEFVNCDFKVKNFKNIQCSFSEEFKN